MRAARGDRYPLFWAMYETFRREFWIGGISQFFASIFQVMSPYTLRYLIAFATEAYLSHRDPIHHRPPPIGRGIGLTFAVTAMQIFQTLGTNHFIYRGMIVGAQSRAVLISIIFEKAMRISGRAKAGGRAILDVDDSLSDQAMHEKKDGLKSSPNLGLGVSGDGTGWPNGRVMNLMATDTYRVDQASGMFHIIWTAPMIMILTLVLLLVNLTYSALAGFGLLIIGTPIFTWSIKVLFVRRAAINKITDQRVGLTQEILQAVRFVKYFGWEGSFLERIGAIRKREIRSIQVLLGLRNAINAVSMSLPIFASMLAFITYALTAHDLSPARIFSSLALFNGLRLPLNFLPLVIGQITDGWSSVCRIQEYLLTEDMNDDFRQDSNGDNAIQVADGEFTWERTVTQDPDRRSVERPASKKDRRQAKKAETDAMKISEKDRGEDLTDEAATPVSGHEPFKLRSLNLSVARNELIAVIGGVGAGKSSLLAALAGDMRKTHGEVIIGGSRAFCPQYAWIQNASLKENILFGKDYNPEWYAKVIEACALGPDLKMLPNGDETEIGERGITVSGGQKQRINIARAIYFDADIVLMDDPLSAVDAQVGRHIFDRAISGLMQSKCRILATHQLHVLHRCDRIIWLHEGRIAAFDTYENLLARNEGFAKMMVGASGDDEETSEKKTQSKTKEKGKKGKSKPAAALMQAEERAIQSVPWGVYSAYISASGSLLNAPLLILVLVVAQGANIVTSLWLSYWISNKFHLSMGQYVRLSPSIIDYYSDSS